MEDPMIERAMKDWENVSADPKLRELYFDRRKAILDRMAAAKAAELREEMARAEGEAKGEAKGKAEGRVEGEIIGKVTMAQDVICRYLNARFGTESQRLQQTVRTLTDLDTLSRITDRVFASSTFDEADKITQEI